MVLNTQELNLNIKPTFVPKTIADFIGEVSTIRNVSEKLVKLDGFIKRLEDEMRKIDAFKRELPISMLLISDAIAALKEELIQCRRRNVEPVFEEFIPLKKTCDEAEKDEKTRMEKECKEKKNWMSSVQLWNNTDDEKKQDTDSDSNRKPNSVVEIAKKSNPENDAKMTDVFQKDVYQSYKGRAEASAFMPFKGYLAIPEAAVRKEAKVEDKNEFSVAGLSLVTPGTSKPRLELGSSVLSSKSSSSIAVSYSSPNIQSKLQTSSSQTSRKQRRCWSPELHRRFVGALQELGGAHVATPKQIRELMQVDGLTNDEVKSHLQKYRLHDRRSPTSKSADSALTLGSALMFSGNGESSTKPRSKSTSPEGPLQLTDTAVRTSTTVSDSMEDEEAERSKSYSWKK
ncbi:hypothetical protein DCAR_0624099 [Daucus carota subsp. sativus]|uniref:HTH myb-type domain-containing protein n=1 Tax=Daucus carota subsp. sativus TaxID=79200 RepID=A0A161ZUT3_DAUCS|nr:hypothetical protein DCAR_0624099 [Daucus carota subsp. sativus]